MTFIQTQWLQLNLCLQKNGLMVKMLILFMLLFRFVLCNVH